MKTILFIVFAERQNTTLNCLELFGLQLYNRFLFVFNKHENQTTMTLDEIMKECYFGRKQSGRAFYHDWKRVNERQLQKPVYHKIILSSRSTSLVSTTRIISSNLAIR